MGGTPKKKMMAEKIWKKRCLIFVTATHIALWNFGVSPVVGPPCWSQYHQVGVASQSSAVLDFHLPSIAKLGMRGDFPTSCIGDLKKNRSWHVHTRTCRPMYQVSGRHACSAFVAASFLNGLPGSFWPPLDAKGAGKPPGLDHWVALHNLPKDHMLSIQVTRFHRAEEELAAVGVWAWNQYAPETKQRFCILQYCELLWTFARQVDKWFPFAKVSFNAFSEVPLSPKGDPSASRLHWPSTEFRRPCV